ICRAMTCCEKEVGTDQRAAAAAQLGHLRPGRVLRHHRFRHHDDACRRNPELLPRGLRCRRAQPCERRVAPQPGFVDWLDVRTVVKEHVRARMAAFVLARVVWIFVRVHRFAAAILGQRHAAHGPAEGHAYGLTEYDWIKRPRPELRARCSRERIEAVNTDYSSRSEDRPREMQHHKTRRAT